MVSTGSGRSAPGGPHSAQPRDACDAKASNRRNATERREREAACCGFVVWLTGRLHDSSLKLDSQQTTPLEPTRRGASNPGADRDRPVANHLAKAVRCPNADIQLAERRMTPPIRTAHPASRQGPTASRSISMPMSAPTIIDISRIGATRLSGAPDVRAARTRM